MPPIVNPVYAGPAAPDAAVPDAVVADAAVPDAVVPDTRLRRFDGRMGPESSLGAPFATGRHPFGRRTDVAGADAAVRDAVVPDTRLRRFDARMGPESSLGAPFATGRHLFGRWADVAGADAAVRDAVVPDAVVPDTRLRRFDARTGPESSFGAPFATGRHPFGRRTDVAGADAHDGVVTMMSTAATPIPNGVG